MPTLAINRPQMLDQNHITGFILKYICWIIQIYNVCGIKHSRAWDLFHDIIILDPDTTLQFSPFQPMWPHSRSWSSPLQVWRAAFRSFRGKHLIQPMTIWMIEHGTNPVTSGIKSITPICRQPAQGRWKAPARVSLSTVAMFPGHWLSYQAAGSTSQVTSWALDHWIGMRYWMRMMILRTGQNMEDYAVEWCVLAKAMTMTTARVRRTCMGLRHWLGKRREQRIGRGKGEWLRTWKGNGRGM